MNYIEQFEAKLRAKIDDAEDDNDLAATVRWASEKLLESYRNGITAGQKGAQMIRHGKSRRPFRPQAQ